jgi:hypothetical protein
MLPNYYTSLKFGDCREFLEDETNFRKLGFKCLDDAAVKRIEEVKENREGGSSDNNSLFDDMVEFDDENQNANLVPSKEIDNGKRQAVANIRMVGQPCYLITNSLDYNMQFNNQNFNDENLTKLLLMLPMVPKKNLDKIKLNHLKLYQNDISQQIPDSVKNSTQIIKRKTTKFSKKTKNMEKGKFDTESSNDKK